MRVAFFSPLPPARSGIADYSEALIESLRPLVELEIFSGAKPAFDANQFDMTRFDIAVYQVGNNAHHDFVYETALRHPGVVVMHESNLHHLITDLTIRRGDWDAYVAECEYHGGAAARAFAERVRKLEVGPDYEGVAMTRRLLETARGVIVHSRFMRDETRTAGYRGPVAVIPHGAWIPRTDRRAYRHRLGLDGTSPLVGIFGFLKPYKRIAESLRAFRRLVRVAPAAKMILVGETHPEFPVNAMIRSMGLDASVRVLGFTPIDEFVGYLAACDIVLNLRYPTVGESSGTLLRSLGLGKAVMVSEVGSFQEFPDDVCLKVPVGAGEEDMIFEYLNLLVARPEAALALGERAKNYVATECNWAVVARKYAGFLGVVASGSEWPPAGPSSDPGSPAVASGAEWQSTEPAGGPGSPATASGAARQPAESASDAGSPAETPQPAEGAPAGELAPYLHGWAHDEEQRWYLNTHETRLAKTLAITPPGGPCDRVLEMGAYLQITPALKTKLGYGEVRGCYYGELGRCDHRTVVSVEGETFECDIDLFDAEKDRFPYPGEYFSTVLCGELIEHLFEDPMHLMSEVNRILKPGGHLVLTTPNIASLRGIAAILQGYHPGLFHSYIKPAESGHVDPRHNREYTPREIHQLLENSGFEVTLLETGGFRDAPHPEYGWVLHLLNRYELDASLRGDGIFAVGRKTGAVRERYPGWLYS
jgi:glycosyltransferase involved in cell wall biosynthesis/SAM-dependent methyltransferase